MPTDIEQAISQQVHEAKQRELEYDCDVRQETRLDLIHRYLHLTKTVMPALAQTRSNIWPVHNDHCFQRIVLDAVCGGVWYDHVSRPAYRHLSLEQAERAVRICEDIIAGGADLADLNQKSLSWRGKRAH
jgi:hypothetical protein